MAKSDRILSLFPSFYEALESYKLLNTVVRRLAQPLEEADTHLFRIQRAHRLLVAEQPDDILRLAALLNLSSFHFEDILTLKTLALEEKLGLMRKRIQRLAQVYLNGLGTPPVILEVAAIFLNAFLVPSRKGAPLIKRLDAEGFSHQATIEFAYLLEKPKQQLYLHENPLRRRKQELSERWPPGSWEIDNQSISPAAPAKFAVQGVGDRTIMPGFYCAQTQQGIVFNGIVPQGRTLIIDAVGGASLDGRPVDEWLIYFEGGVADLALADQTSCVIEDDGRVAPFAGQLEVPTARPFRRRKPAPQMPAGRSNWYFTVAEGVFDHHGYDFAVCSLPHAPIGIFDGDFQFDACVYNYEPSAVVGMAWDERMPHAFKLLLPAELPQSQAGAAAKDSEGAGDKTAASFNHVSRMGSLIARFRAAGVAAFVDSAREAWILGEGLLRTAEAVDGLGIQHQTTRLQDWHTELLVSAD